MRQYQRAKVPVHPAVHKLIHLLWHLMHEHRTSQEDVAERAGVSASAMRKWRAGRRSPNLTDVEACLNVFDVEITTTYRKPNRS